MSFKYVALGDSTVEGLEDPGPDGVYVGWADRFAQHLTSVHEDVRYANLAVRGLTAREVRDSQIAPALALGPDLAVVVAGVNDILRPRFDARRVREDLFSMHRALREAGSDVLTFTMPDMGRVAPLAAVLRRRFEALNAITHDLHHRLGTRVVDLAAEPVASDPALWHDDRLHANSDGHRRIALALAEAMGIHAGDWREPLPEAPRDALAAVVSRELGWVARHLLPWAWGLLRNRPPAVPPVCKRPELAPVVARG